MSARFWKAWRPGWSVPQVPPLSWAERAVFTLGTGFGSGFLRPFSPSWGSLVGFAYAAALLQLQSLTTFIVLTGAGILFSIPICGKSAHLLRDPDPKCVVLDEICCAPLALLPAFGGSLSWWQWLIAFITYRLADGIKPFPARRLENLPGGWGIVLDDVVSSLYMSGLWFLGQRLARHS